MFFGLPVERAHTGTSLRRSRLPSLSNGSGLVILRVLSAVSRTPRGIFGLADRDRNGRGSQAAVDKAAFDGVLTGAYRLRER